VHYVRTPGFNNRAQPLAGQPARVPGSSFEPSNFSVNEPAHLSRFEQV
jgi:hypothetical protein